MFADIRENIVDLSEYGPILPLIEDLKVKSFTYKSILNTPKVEDYFDPNSGDVLIKGHSETYIEYPQGIQVMIEPSSLENMYPEGVVTSEDGTKYYRFELVTAFLVQAVKELKTELSARIEKLEKAK